MSYIEAGYPNIGIVNNFYIHLVDYGGLLNNFVSISGLPPGLTYAESFGRILISGTPTQTGVYKCSASGISNITFQDIVENFVIIIQNTGYNNDFEQKDYFRNRWEDTDYVTNSITTQHANKYYKFFDNARFTHLDSGWINFVSVLESTDIFPHFVNFSGSFTGDGGFLSYPDIKISINNVEIPVFYGELDQISQSSIVINQSISSELRANITANRRLYDGDNDILSVSIYAGDADPSMYVRMHSSSIGFTGSQPVYRTIPNPSVTTLYPIQISGILIDGSITNSSGNSNNLIDYINNLDNNTCISGDATWSADFMFNMPSGHVEQNKKIDKIRINATFKHPYGSGNVIEWNNPIIFKNENDILGWSRGFGFDQQESFIEKGNYFVNLETEGFDNSFESRDFTSPDIPLIPINPEIAFSNHNFYIRFKKIPELAQISSISLDLYSEQEEFFNMFCRSDVIISISDTSNFYSIASDSHFDSIDFYTIRHKQTASAFAFHLLCKPEINNSINQFLLGSPAATSSFNMFVKQDPINIDVDMYCSAYTTGSEDISIFLRGQPSFDINNNVLLFINSSTEDSNFSIIPFYINSEVDRNNVITMFVSTNNVEDDNEIKMYLNSDNTYDKTIGMFAKNNREESFYKFDAVILSSYKQNDSINMFTGD